MAKPIGAVVSLYYDGRAQCEEGDIIETVTTGRCYRVISNRIQERGKWAGRQHLKCMVIDPSEKDGGDVVHPLAWYSRG